MTIRKLVRPSHPKLYVEEATIERLKEKIADEPYKKGWRHLRERAEELRGKKLVDESYCKSGAGQHGNYFVASDDAKNRLELFSLLYELTGEAEWIERARETMLHYASFERWTGVVFSTWVPPWHSALETAGFCKAMATGYDCFYNDLSVKERKVIADALVRSGVQPLVDDWLNPHTHIHALDSMGHNWWCVCASGAGIGALALIDDYPQAERWARYVYEALKLWFDYSGNVLQNKPRNFGVEGGYYEGISYLNYSLQYFFYFIDAYMRVFGDLEALNIPQLRDVPVFYLLSLYPGNDGSLSVNFGDSGLRAVAHPEVAVFYASKFKSKHMQWYYQTVHVYPKTVHEFLWFDDCLKAKLPYDLKPSKSFEDIGWTIVRSGWTDRDFLLSVKSGATWNHAHADAGTFILYAYGEPLIIDSGKCDYSHRLYREYYTESHAHNIILFNGRGQDTDDVYRGSKFPGRIPVFLDSECYKYLYADATGPYAPILKRNHRHFIIFPRYVIVIDDLLSNYREKGTYEWLLHFAGNFKQVDRGIKIEKGKAALRVDTLFPEETVVETRDGYWDSTMEKTPYLSIKAKEASSDMKFMTVLTPYTKEEDRNLPEIILTKNEDLTGLEIRLNGQVDRVFCNISADGRLMHKNSMRTFSGIRTDAFLVTVSSNEETGEMIGCSIHNGSSLSIDGRLMFHSPIKSDAVLYTYPRRLEARISSCERALLHMELEKKPERVLINDRPLDKYNYEREQRLLKVTLPKKETRLDVKW